MERSIQENNTDTGSHIVLAAKIYKLEDLESDKEDDNDTSTHISSDTSSDCYTRLFGKNKYVAENFEQILRNMTNIKKIERNNQCTLSCPICGINMGNDILWEVHLKEEHHFETLDFEYTDAKTVACRQCFSSFHAHDIRQLQFHSITHSPHSRYIRCNLCNELFSSLEVYSIHSAEVHIDVDSNNFNFEEHIKHICMFCGLIFNYGTEWACHLNDIHQFNNPKSLNMKINTHTATCQECNAVLFEPNNILNMQAHRQTHLPYKFSLICRLCSKKYVGIHQIKEHLLTRHYTEIQQSTPGFLCPFCGSKFESNFNWQQHLDNVHNFADLNMQLFDNCRKAKCLQCASILRPISIEHLMKHRLAHLHSKKKI